MLGVAVSVVTDDRDPCLSGSWQRKWRGFYGREVGRALRADGKLEDWLEEAAGSTPATSLRDFLRIYYKASDTLTYSHHVNITFIADKMDMEPPSLLGGSFLLGVGVWVLVDPTGFKEIVAANPLLFTGVYIILAMGGMLFLLGFLGCCGAIRENKCLLMFFFMLILVIFLAELAAAILAFIFREHLTREYFTKELKRHYQGYNNTDVFTGTWNAIMNTFDCCGVNSPVDFEESLFRRINPNEMVPAACCRRGSHPGDSAYIPQEECLMGNMLFRNNKGCYSAVVDYFELYIYVAGALAIVVLTIELFAMVFAMCLFRGIQ